MSNRTTQHYIGRRQFLYLGATAASSLALFGIAGCSPSENQQATSSSSFNAGTYTAQAQGKKALLTVEATFSESSIDSITVTDHMDTERIAHPALTSIPAQIIEYQSLGIDTITGATLTSLGVLAAAKDCVKQAGGNVQELEKAPGRPQSTEIVDIDADIAIIGAGAAGMAAAISAAQNGSKVVVFEKCGNVGGNALVSGGVLTYVDAPDELRQEMTDSFRTYIEETLEGSLELGVPQEAIDTIRADYDAYYASGNTKTFNSTELNAVINLTGAGGGEYEGWRAYSETNGPLLDWFSEFNIEWNKLIGINGYPYPAYAKPTHGDGGEGFFAAFDKEMESKNLPIEILFCTPASKLIEENGTVVGATGVCDDGTTYNVTATKGVVLATGGYSGSPELLRKNDHGWGFDKIDVIPTTNAYGHTGDGVFMAEEVGGTFVTDEFNCIVIPFSNARDNSIEALIGETGSSLLINSEGVRFVDESGDRNGITKELMKQTNQVGYLICDKENSLIENNVTSHGVKEEILITNQQLYKADTLAELAKAIGVDAATLEVTVADYNTYSEQESDPEFGRTFFTDLCPITEGPFYACPVTWAVHITSDGILTDDMGAVLTESGEAVPGLYAIGEVTPCGGGLDVFFYGLAVGQGLSQA